MKKMVLGISMTLACLIFLVPPATAAGVPQGAPELSAFLASLAGPAPVTAAKSPALREKAIAAAAANCVGGGSVSCSGITCSGVDGNCSVNEPGHVTCDGVTTWCPNTCLDCATEEYNCSLNCSPCSYNFSCNETTQTSTCHCALRGCPQ